MKRSDQWPPVLDKQETLLVDSFDDVSIDKWSDDYGHQNKLAGFGKEAAQWTADRWNENGFKSRRDEYHVYLRYPVSASIHFTSGDGEVSEVNLREGILLEDDVTALDVLSQQMWLGYPPTGNASAEYIYAG